MLNNVIDKLLEVAGGDPGARNPTSPKSPPPPKIISMPAPYKPAPTPIPFKPPPKKPTKIFPAGSSVDLCPACGQEVRGGHEKGGTCLACGYHYKKPITVDIKTAEQLPPDAFGRTSTMPSGKAVRLKQKKYRLPKKEEDVMKTEDDRIEATIDGLVKEGSAATVGHLALDLLGLIPGAEAFDAANMLWYIKEKKWLPAVFSLISVIPAIGDVIGKSAKYGGKLATWLTKTFPKGGKAIIKHAPGVSAKIRKLELALKANSQIIAQVLDTASQDPNIGKYVPEMKNALNEFQRGGARGEAVERETIEVESMDSVISEISAAPNQNIATTGFEALPDSCFGKLPSTGEVIRIDKGQSGYMKYKKNDTGEPMIISDEQLDAMNAEIGVTPKAADAMMAGSMFGWGIPAVTKFSESAKLKEGEFDYTPDNLPDEYEEDFGDYNVTIDWDWNEIGYPQAFVEVKRGISSVATASWNYWSQSGSFSEYEEDIPSDVMDDIRNWLDGIQPEIDEIEDADYFEVEEGVVGKAIAFLIEAPAKAIWPPVPVKGPSGNIEGDTVACSNPDCEDWIYVDDYDEGASGYREVKGGIYCPQCAAQMESVKPETTDDVEAMIDTQIAEGGDLKFEPYIGGAGPEPEQRQNNNAWLRKQLKAADIPTGEGNLKDIWPDSEFQDESAIVVHRGHKKLYVSFDRWGYVIDIINTKSGDFVDTRATLGIEGDQEGPDVTVNAITKWYNKGIRKN